MPQRILVATFVTISLLATPVLSEPTSTNSQAAAKAHLNPDESWITISGHATEVGPDSFLLEYGSGKVFVEMDEKGERYFQNPEVLDGDIVTVYGKVDDDTSETTSIEAHSVYLENLDTYFQADPADEERRDLNLDARPDEPLAAGEVSISGTITSIGEDKFTLDVGKRQMTVVTSELDYNPLEAGGIQRLEPGLIVTVSGRALEGTFEDRRLVAETVVPMSNQPTPSFRVEGGVVPPRP